MKSGEYQRFGENWPTATAMTELDGSLYLVNDEKLYRIDPADGAYAQVGDELWRPKFMFGAKGQLFVVDHDGSFFRIDPASGAYTQVDRYTWAKLQATAVVLDVICFFSDGGLYVVNGDDGTYRAVGNDTWNPRAACGFNNLYEIDQDGTMYKIAVADGQWWLSGEKYDWSSSGSSLARVGDFGYLVNNGTLYRTQPGGGAYWKLSSDTWDLKFLVGCRGDLFGLQPDGAMYRIGADIEPAAS
jgi:hypothetical protein